MIYQAILLNILLTVLSVSALCRTAKLIENKTEACFEISQMAISRFRCGLGKLVLFKHFDLSNCNIEDDDLSFEHRDSCVYSPRVHRNFCITPQMIYALGKAAHEPCNLTVDMDRRCFGDFGVIKCDGNEILNNHFKCKQKRYSGNKQKRQI